MAESGSLHDFWLSSGYHLLDRDEAGNLRLTPDFLAAYLRRPELAPPAGADAEECRLHARLLADPLAPIAESDLARLGDEDARGNYAVYRRFRDRLVQAGTLEGAYLAAFREGPVDLPPLFLDHLAHAILRNLLDGCDDSIALRATELLFRSQKATIRDGAVMLADEETVAALAESGGMGSLGRLLATNATPLKEVALDVLSPETSGSYWSRSDRFDMVLDLTFARPGLDALCRVLERWVWHFLKIRVAIEPVRRISDERWSWHLGLDVESTAILNALYRGEAVAEADVERLLSLFRLTFVDPGDMLPDLAGKPVYMGLAMDDAKRLRLKPQNLLLNLPLARPV
jgi:Family of unknown function (DUF6352)